MKTKALALLAEPKGFSSEAKQILSHFCQIDEYDCDRQNLLERVRGVDVLFTRLRHKIDQEVFSQAQQLKYIVSPTTGLDHIDLEEAKRRKIQIVSLQGETSFLKDVPATAELTWGLILSLMRKIPQALKSVCDDHWNRDQFIGMDLKGKTLGIIGFGRIGRLVAEYAGVFGMNILVHDPFHHDQKSDCHFLSLEEVLKNSDIITVHVNLNEKNKNLLGEKDFSQMKKGACFINTSRGNLIDEEALLKALKSKRLAGAALDVLSNEADQKFSLSKNKKIWQYCQTQENLLITPHIGGATKESMAMTEVFVVNKLKEMMMAV